MTTSRRRAAGQRRAHTDPYSGTEKFPNENEYSAFLSEHGGASNAYTAAEQTNYHFEVAPDALHETLDRFAAFFTCPLFTASATARELQVRHTCRGRGGGGRPHC